MMKFTPLIKLDLRECWLYFDQKCHKFSSYSILIWSILIFFSCFYILRQKKNVHSSAVYLQTNCTISNLIGKLRNFTRNLFILCTVHTHDDLFMVILNFSNFYWAIAMKNVKVICNKFTWRVTGMKTRENRSS